MKTPRRFCLIVLAAFTIVLISHNWLVRIALGETGQHLKIFEKEAALPYTEESKNRSVDFAEGSSARKGSVLPNDMPSRDTENTTVVPYLNQEGKCHLKILVYDKNEELGGDKRPTLKDLVKKKVGGHWMSEVRFRNNCSLSIVFGNNLNAFNDVDAVVVHIIGDFVPKWYTPHINRKRKWIFFSWKPPEPQDARFPVDATWTYHRKSDMRMPYGYYIPDKPTTKRIKSPEEWVAGKTKKVLWIASHCNGTTWPRFDFVNELRRHIPVDVYGKCGDLDCQPHWAPQCMGDLLERYKFYLAFENRECEDYITEKAWEKPLQYGTVPVVYGPTRNDYEAVLPPNSFIHISDFKSIEELAKYLSLLDANPEKYTQYMEWRYKGSVEVTRKMFDSFPPRMFGDIFSVMAKLKEGKLKRTVMGKTKIYQTCRDQRTELKDRPAGTYGVGKWFPW